MENNTITLLAGIPSTSVEARLKECLRKCDKVRGVVAYWTLPVENLSGTLIEALKKTGSFYCADMERPTDISHLGDFVRAGASIYLHTYEIVQQTTNEAKGPSGLLHAKVILFDLPGNKAQLWVGSHNFTRRALKGINSEASLVIDTTQNSDIYKQTETYLEAVRKCSVKLEPKDVPYYKFLQGNPSEKVLKELIGIETGRAMMRKSLDIMGYDVANLYGETLQLIGLDTGSLTEIHQPNFYIILSVLDLETDQEHYYVAQVRQGGVINTANYKYYGSTDVPRRYVLLDHDLMPYLCPERSIDNRLLGSADYFVLLDVMPYQVSSAYSVPDEQIWGAVLIDARIKDTPSEAKGQLSLIDSSNQFSLRKATPGKTLVWKQNLLRTISPRAKQFLPLHYHNRIKRIIGYKQFEPQETRPIAPAELHREDNMAGRRIVHYVEQLPEPVQQLKRPRR